MTHTLTRAALSLLSLIILAGAALAADPGPGASPDATSEASDQKAGSLLYYNAYTSDAASPTAANTRINITNINQFTGVAVHLFFVNGSDCSIADNYICLTANQTGSFLATEMDPGSSGYIVAIASSSDGFPIQFNFLIGDEYVKYATGHAANLGAVAFAKRNNANFLSPDGTLAQLFFDGLNLAGSYNRAPRVVALDNIPARADGNDTLLILNRVGGNLGIGAATLTGGGVGNLFGILYNDVETPYSFSFPAPVCQFRTNINNNFPRTAPRVENIIPATRSGWMKLYSLSDIGILGAMINRAGSADAAPKAFGSGHNLHHLTLTTAANLVIPIFPSNCPEIQSPE